MSSSPRPQTPLTPAADGTDKAVRALTLFETLRTSLAADNLHGQSTGAAVAASHSGQTGAVSSNGTAKKPKLPHATAAAASTSATTAAEDPEKRLLRRQLQHAERLVKQLHDQNTALRHSIQRLEETGADSRAQLTATTASAAQQERQQQHAMSQLESKVKELSAALANQQRQQSKPEAPAAPSHPPAMAETHASSQIQSMRVLALESEVAALSHRVQLCEAQRDRLAEVQLASVLLPPTPSQGQLSAAAEVAKQSAQEARIAKLVNTEVRKLFSAMRQQLVEEASLREAERSRRNELLFLLERKRDAESDSL